MSEFLLCTDEKLALYGLGTETERFINENSSWLNIAGLLDGFRTDGEMFGYPIITLDDALEKGVSSIIVIARPGSCKVIAKRIGQFCRDNNISLINVSGKNLLEIAAASYDFSNIACYRRKELIDRTDAADVISFDLFDTLVTRTVYSYTDIFDILDLRLKEEKVSIPGFSNLRLRAEKELSKDTSPTLVQIYAEFSKYVKTEHVTPEKLASMEWEIDQRTIIARKETCDFLNEIKQKGKKIVITTDSYYSYDQICQILNMAGIDNVDNILVSSEYGTLKTQNLLSVIKEVYPHKKILHIGDDSYSDIDKAAENGIDSFKIYSGTDLFDELGGLGIRWDENNLTDRIKIGLFVSKLFNSPFQFEDSERKLTVRTSRDVGFILCAPMISDFIHWMVDELNQQSFERILFCARDGYLPRMLFDRIAPDVKNYYFLSSRTAAIRSGMEDEPDIKYVDSMKYFGSDEEALKNRFGISSENQESADRNREILIRSAKLRKNYKRYIDTFDFGDDKIALFDFVAKGTSQLYLQKLFPQHLKGFYFLQLEPEYMADRGLDIEPFYTDKEKDQSSIYENYYILETILTAPHPQVLEFDEKGMPVYAEETRKEGNLKVIEQVQRGIIEYFERLSALIPLDHYVENKKLDESILSLINKLKISDEGFMSLTVEDPFFGRMTDIKDLIG